MGLLTGPGFWMYPRYVYLDCDDNFGLQEIGFFQLSPANLAKSESEL